MKISRIAMIVVLFGSVCLGQNTPYLNLNLPAYASGNWNVPVNQNFSILDSYLGGVTPFPNPLQTSITGTATGDLPITGGTITGNLVVTGTFTCTGCPGVSFPGAGIPNSNGTDYLTSYGPSNTIPANFISTLNQNTTGTAGNLSGTPLLPNGTTAYTQTLGDMSAALTNDQFLSNTLASPPTIGSFTPAPGTSQFTNIASFGNISANNFSVGTNVVLPTFLTGYHGTTGANVQLSDGTGTAGYSCVFAADGSITNGTAPPYIPPPASIDQYVTASGSCSGIGCTATVTVTWPTAFADTSYQAVCSPYADNSSMYITSKTTTGLSVVVVGITGTVSVDCFGHHS